MKQQGQNETEDQKINNKLFKLSAKHITFISKIKQHIQQKHQDTFDYFCEVRSIVGIFIQTYKAKHNVLASLHERTKENPLQTGHSFCEITKRSAQVYTQEVCLAWKLFPVINRLGVGIRMSWVEKIEKLISSGGFRLAYI